MVDRVSPLPQDNNDNISDHEEIHINAASHNKKRSGVSAELSPKKIDEKKAVSKRRRSRPRHKGFSSKSKAHKSKYGQDKNTTYNKDNGITARYNGSTYAALDLGTNNCRLLIAKPGEGGFTIIDAFSRVVRLGEGLTSSGRISDQAMDRAVDALAICAQKLKRRNVALSRSVATEACRQADNGNKFIERVRNETGIILDIISSEEEARLAVLGCHILLPKGHGPALIFDIGGGSTELVLVSTDNDVPEIIEWVSVPWGVVTLTESELVEEDSVDARMIAYENMRQRVKDSFADFASNLPQDGDFRTLGTSGTITTLASVYLNLPYYNRNKVDGISVPADAMREISQELAKKSPKERGQLPCIGEQRSDLVVAGCAILESILDIWPSAQLGVADRGIREGILRSLMKINGSISLRSKQ